MQTRKKTLNFKFIFAAALTVATLAGCGPISAPTTNPSVDESTTNPTLEPSTNPSIEDTYTSVIGPTTVPSVSDPTTVPPTEKPTTSIDPTTNKPTNDPTTSPNINKEVTFDIYTINDFHGATQYTAGTYPQIGLAKMSTVFRSFAEESTSFFLSSGDMWQETIESNSNYGEYVTIAMNRIGFDAMTIGNHEFDWGSQYITKNAKLADYPILGANIVEKSTGYLIDEVVPSTIVEKDGVKLGVIGVIGPAQYSSISAQYVVDYDFEDEYKHVVAQAKYLRDNGADLIVLSSHDTYNDVDFTDMKKKAIDDAGIDMVIAGHSHTFQEEVYTRKDGQRVPVLQAYSKGTNYGHVNFTINTETDELTLNSYKVKDFKNYVNVEPDQYIVDLYKNNYDVDDLKVEEVCTTTAKFSRNQLAILASTAIYEKLNAMDEWKDYNILTAFHNSARKELAKGLINYEALFASLPFDNEIIVYQVSKSYVTNSYYYTHSGYKKSSANFSGKRYVAGIDYVAYKSIAIEDGIRTGLYVRDIVKEYLQNKKVVTPSDYTN